MKKSNYTSTIMTISTHLKTENPDQGESTVKVTLVDEGCGLFITLRSLYDGAEISVDFEQLELICKQAKILIDNFKEGEEK